MKQLITFPVAGLMLAAFVGLAAWLLGRWESYRPQWPGSGTLDRLSIRLRRMGLFLLWLESVLLAIGSQMPVEVWQDRVFFVTIWSVIGTLAILLLLNAMIDSVIRFFAHRVRATAIQQVMKQKTGNDTSGDDDTPVIHD